MVLNYNKNGVDLTFQQFIILFSNKYLIVFQFSMKLIY